MDAPGLNARSSQARAPVRNVVQQHADDAAVLRNTRSLLVRAPHAKLQDLQRLDARLLAHLDGLGIAGAFGSMLAKAALETPAAGQVFTAAVLAIGERDPAGLERIFALAEVLPAARAGLISAFGWVPAVQLRGITTALLAAPDAFRRGVGLASCAMHQVDPGDALVQALDDGDAALRARALRVAGVAGRCDLRPACADALRDEDPRCACAAAHAAVLLGDRRAGMAALHEIASMPGPWRREALALLLKLHAPAEAHAVLRSLSGDALELRLLIQCIGIAGDPVFVPWLIEQMHDLPLARIAGEAFSLITGLDLADRDLERKPPEDFEAGPADDPADDNVAPDEDEGLAWPDPERIGACWQSEGHRCAAGTRYFMGEPPTSAQCRAVLASGCQRQRIAAAQYLCLLQPGTQLFPTAAPAWRQQRWLAALGALGALGA